MTQDAADRFGFRAAATLPRQTTEAEALRLALTAWRMRLVTRFGTAINAELIGSHGSDVLHYELFL